MFKEAIELRDKVDPEKLRKATAKKILLGLHRAADVVAGSLREHSLRLILHGRTGNLAREWTLVPDPEDPFALIMRNRSPQARILEQGGDIRPKSAKALAIPMEGPALTERGVPRFRGPREAQSAGHRLFVFVTGGKPYLVESTAEGRLAFWYALRGGVTIPPKRYATKAVEAAAAPATAEIKRALEE